MDECVLAISFFSLPFSLFLKERHNLSRFVHYFLREQTYPRILKNNLQFNLQLTRRHAPASAFLWFSKVFLTRSMSGHIAENIYTFMLMNTERTYVRHTYRFSCRFVLFSRRKTKKEKKRRRSRRNGKRKDELRLRVFLCLLLPATDDSCSVNAS